MKKDIKILGFASVVLLLLNIVQILYMQSSISDISKGYEFKESNTYAVAKFCLNNRPSGIINNCNFTIPWGYYYECRNLTGADLDYGSLFYWQSAFVTATDLFNITPGGSFNVTPPKSAVGNHTIRIFMTDNSGCDNSIISQDFNISIVLANHAPYLAYRIPNGTLLKDNSLSFYLDDYFIDPDGDPLSYLSLMTSSSFISVTIQNSSLVTIKGLDCGDTFVAFIATDPYNLTNTSNTVKYVVSGCPEKTENNTKTKGGAGGGSGGSVECIPQWQCGKWSSCRPENRTYLECRDYMACDHNHYLETLSKNCTYVSPIFICQENWECEEWSTCINDTHTRTCLDKNSCGTNSSKPTQSENCTVIPTCFNGIKDPEETGIDCGGPCGSCKSIEQPTPVKKFPSTSIIIAGILTVLMVLLIIYALRQQIKKWFFAAKKQKRKKHIYLQAVQKERLLQELFILQTRYDEKRFAYVISSIPAFIRNYFRELLGIDQLSKETLSRSIINLKDKTLEAILMKYYERMLQLESHNIRSRISAVELQMILDLMLHNIYLVSEFTEKDAITCVKERTLETNRKLELCYLELSNILITLQFNELAASKKSYMDIMKDYESLTPQEKVKAYPDIMISYDLINYAEKQNES
jgi:hypothetical protein